MPASSISSAAAISILGMFGLVACSHHQPAPFHSLPSPQATACEPANGREGQPGCWVLGTERSEPLVGSALLARV